MVTLKAQVTPEAATAWQEMCDREGVTFSAMTQAYGEMMVGLYADAEYSQRQNAIIKRAREITAERRRRNQTSRPA